VVVHGATASEILTRPIVSGFDNGDSRDYGKIRWPDRRARNRLNNHSVAVHARVRARFPSFCGGEVGATANQNAGPLIPLKKAVSTRRAGGCALCIELKFRKNHLARR